ncbi:putative oxidoreductase, aryl-alcohol dehydrogenase like protein precursor [Sphingobium yanoikuyae]|uniref:Putative oxidoreductase, aryl-alcohol dehydrogenase like protein n=1 Tax=Sphingobium yanoikuyae TaxID=13690 RepID=A0A084ETI4_SPHYA|nr:putative oxidoreductase, aryl-alcohol dehydrogenase like protein precursor [Sphingobium yanoikuyae]
MAGFSPLLMQIVPNGFSRKWLSVDCEIPGFAAARVKLISRVAITKILRPVNPWPGLNRCPDPIKRAVEGSLRQTRAEPIDLLYLNRADPAASIAVGAIPPSLRFNGLRLNALGSRADGQSVCCSHWPAIRL